MIVTRHVWRTEDGRLVEDGDPEAAFLAYPAGSELGDAEAERLGLPLTKQAAKPADKTRVKPEDK